MDSSARIILTEAYGPRGDNLIGISDVTFDGHPALTLLVRAGAQEGLVHFSPIHGDKRKETSLDIPAGTRCELVCPVSGEPLASADLSDLDTEDDVSSFHDARHYAVYLTRELTKTSMVTVSDIAGHDFSIVRDNLQAFSPDLIAQLLLERVNSWQTGDEESPTD